MVVLGMGVSFSSHYSHSAGICLMHRGTLVFAMVEQALKPKTLFKQRGGQDDRGQCQQCMLCFPTQADPQLK